MNFSNNNSEISINALRILSIKDISLCLDKAIGARDMVVHTKYPQKSFSNVLKIILFMLML